MIDAMAQAAGVLQQPRYLQAAQRAAKFLLETLRRDDGRVGYAALPLSAGAQLVGLLSLQVGASASADDAARSSKMFSASIGSMSSSPSWALMRAISVSICAPNSRLS